MLKSVVLSALVGVTSVLAVKCDRNNKCPEATPCCSQYGECGVGAYCLGGCDPTTSFSIEACAPAPVCEDRELKFDSLKNIADIGSYLGDPSEADWVVSGEPALHNGNTLLTMPKGSVGTVLSSTSYIWYGNVKARMKTSRGRGVITAFILFSDVKDEIDYEWVGVDLETAQTNFYFQGHLNYENSENITLSDTFSNFHDYEVRWTPDKIEWVVDGEVGRVQERKDTWNKTSQQWDYPQTPARLQLSLWPGGLASNPKGTRDWAGGLIDWEHTDIKNAGYFYAEIESVTIECYDGKDGLGTHNGKSYYYDDIMGTNDTVVDGDKNTILGSIQATGLDMDKGKKEEEDDDDDDDDDDKNDDVRTVPGGSSGTVPGSDEDEDDEAGDQGSSGGSGSPPANYDPGSFDQGLQDGSNSGDSDGSGGNSGGSTSSASALAMIIAGCALYWL